MNDIDYLSALTVFRFTDGRTRPWAVTVADVSPHDWVNGIVTFATKEEAQAFLLAEQRRQSATAPL